MANKAFKKVVENTTLAYDDWRSKLEGIALGSWLYDFPKEFNGQKIEEENLIDTRWFEKQLLHMGSLAFFIEPDLGVPVVMNWTFSTQYDRYGNPNGITVYSPYIGYTANLKRGEYVIIWDNLERESISKFLNRASYRLYDLDGIIDVNAKVQKTPAIFVTPEDKRLTNKNFWAQVDVNNPVIMVGKDFNKDDYTILDLSSGGNNFKGQELMDLSTAIYNQALARIGVQSSVALKRERMVENEVEQLRSFALANRRSRILARKQAFELIKDKFGYDMKFEFFEGFEVGTNDVTKDKFDIDVNDNILGEGGED